MAALTPSNSLGKAAYAEFFDSLVYFFREGFR